jgi:hypothetical protein
VLDGLEAVSHARVSAYNPCRMLVLPSETT